MPRRVDHEVRRRQITDAVARITARGGLSSATFREIAAEAGVSVRLVQYYFRSKDQVLLAAQQHLAARVTQRLRSRIAHAGEDPRHVIRAIFEEFLPHDDESRQAMLLFVALYVAALTDPSLARAEALEVPRALQALIAGQLHRARLRRGVNAEEESVALAALVAGLGQAVLGGAMTAEDALTTVEYLLDRVVLDGAGKTPRQSVSEK